MGALANFREAEANLTRIGNLLNEIGRKYRSDGARLSNGKMDAPLVDSCASGWKAWTASLLSHVNGVVSEVHSSYDLIQAVWGSSDRDEPGTHRVFAESTELPCLKREYKTSTLTSDTRMQRSAVKSEAETAVAQLKVPARVGPGDMQQAEIKLENDNPWPCTGSSAIPVNEAYQTAWQNCGHTAARRAKLTLARELEKHAAAISSTLSIDPKMSVTVFSQCLNRLFRFSPGKVLCDTVPN